MMDGSSQQDMAWRMINAAICSYQVHPPGWVPPKKAALNTDSWGPLKPPYTYQGVAEYQDQVGFPKTVADGYMPLFTSTGVDDINAALVGPMTDGNMLVSIRGTIPPNEEIDDLFDWLDDWWQDFEMGPKPWTMETPNPNSNPMVETGFDDALMGNQKYGKLWENIVEMMEKTEKDNGCTGVIVTGHSKGAGMTFLVASKIHECFPQFRGKIQVYAYAAPVVGNKDFQTAYDALNIPSHRYQVKNDLVPFLALWIGESIYPAVRFPGFWNFWKRCLWKKLTKKVTRDTKGGYYVVGDTTYFPTKGSPDHVSDASAALTAVAGTIVTDGFVPVAKAHSAVNSYRPHFVKPKS